MTLSTTIVNLDDNVSASVAVPNTVTIVDRSCISSSSTISSSHVPIYESPESLDLSCVLVYLLGLVLLMTVVLPLLVLTLPLDPHASLF